MAETLAVRTLDRLGNEVYDVDFHPAYHELMALGFGAGAHSLALNIDGTGTDSSYIEISLNLCPGNALATGIQGAFRASIWFKPTDGGGGVGGPGYATLQSGNSSIGGIDSNCPANQWFEVPTQPVAGVSVSHVDLSIGGLEGRKGVLYFDNLRFD